MTPLPESLAKGNWQGSGQKACPLFLPSCPLLPSSLPSSFLSWLSVRGKAGGSLWLTFHDSMPLEIAVPLISPLVMTGLPQGLAL